MESSTIPLSPEDRAILDLESPHVAGHTCKVIVLAGGRPGLGALRDEIIGRLGAAPELLRRLDGPADARVWCEDRTFDPTAHIVAADEGGEMNQPRLLETVGELFAQRLDRSRPLWRMDIVPLTEGGSAIVWRIHHALADGTTAMRLARAVLFDEGTESVEAPPQRGSTHAAEDDARRRHHLAGLLRREFARGPTRSPFDARIGPRREIEFARMPLKRLHDGAKHLAGATVNDAVLACVAGGLRHWIELHHGELGDMRVKVPVSLHHGGDSLGNRDSFFAVTLPIGEPDPLERLRQIHAETAERKDKHDAAELDDLTRELGRVAPRMERLARRLERSPRRFALNVSNVPGPLQRMSILGEEVSSLHTLAEIGERHALRVAAVSYADQLCLGLCADPEVVHDLGDLARAIEVEAQSFL
jgi:diacylglycerol O-acyltransferase